MFKSNTQNPTEANNQPRLEKNPYLTFKSDAPLQELFEHPYCPAIIKNALSNEVAWHKRNEYKVANGIRWSPHYAAALLACEAIIVTADSEETVDAYINRQGAIAKVKLIRIPAYVTDRCFGEAHIRRTPSDNPLISAVASLTTENQTVVKAIIALFGVWEEGTHIAHSAEILLGKSLSPHLIQIVAEAVKQEVQPKDHYLASAAYRREMAGVLTKRALSLCL